MTITRNQRNVLLWLLSAALAIAGVAVLAVAWFLPIDNPSPSSPAMTYAVGPPSDVAPPLPSLSSLQRLAQLTLYHPPQDPSPAPAATAPATQPAPAPPPPPPLNVQLIGTIIEPDNARAFFQLPSGRVVLRRVGQTVAGAGIVRIDTQSASLEYQGRTLTLQAPRRGMGGQP